MRCNQTDKEHGAETGTKLGKGGAVKKVAVGLAVLVLVVSVLVIVGHKGGTVKSQTSSQPAVPTSTSSTPTASTPPASTAPTTSASYTNRPVGRWVTSHMVFLTTLINDTNRALGYLKNENLAYAEVACPQLRCDIATMQGRPPPADSLASSRALRAAPSGYICPPIPDAQTMADLNVGMAQLETAINSIITGENRFDGPMIQSALPQMQAASDTFEKVLVDLGKAQGSQ